MKYFYPDYYFHCVEELSPEFFLARGISHVIFDIDDTLVAHGIQFPSKEISDFLTNFKNHGLTLSFISNSKGARAKIFAEKLPFDSFVICHAQKPSKKALTSFFNQFRVDKHKVAFVGDQLLTDVWLCKRWHILSVLVKPIAPFENPFFYFKRAVERPILNSYFKHVEAQNAQKETD